MGQEWFNIGMKKILRLTFVLGLAGLVFTACKPTEQAPTPPPVVSKTPPAEVAKPEAAKPAALAEPSKPADPIILTPQQAKDHVGEEATVRGKVFGVHVSQKGDVFMNIGAAYPNAPFIAVCFQGAIPADDLKKFNGKTVSVKGKIKEHNSQAEIILDSPDQISE